MAIDVLSETDEVKTELSVQTRHLGKSVRSREPWLRAAVRKLAPQEVFMLVFAVILVLVAVIGSALVTEWKQVLIRMFLMTCVILGMGLWASYKDKKWMRIVKAFYVAPLIPIFFKTTELISYALHGKDYDDLLIVADRLFFGVNPTVWIYQHLPVVPGFIEYLQVCYSLFYFLPILLAAELYRRMRLKEDLGMRPIERRQLDQLLFVVVYGFMLSYAAYFLFPSVGPRFTIHNFFATDRELPGVFLTGPIRTLLNRGENITNGMSLEAIRHAVTRDAFPSGHTDITLLTIILAFRFRAKTRWAILVLGSSLIFSTVYLRYHYVVDVIGGALLAMITLYTWQWVRLRTAALRRAMLQAM